MVAPAKRVTQTPVGLGQGGLRLPPVHCSGVPAAAEGRGLPSLLCSAGLWKKSYEVWWDETCQVCLENLPGDVEGLEMPA